MINVILPTRVADFDPLRVGASVQTCPGLAISNIRLKRALFNRLLAGRDDLKAFGQATLAETSVLRGQSSPGAQHLLQALAVADLALVTRERSVLAFERVGDVNDHRRLKSREPHDRHRVRLEAFAHEFWERVGITRVGIDRSQGRLARGQVVGVTREDALKVAFRTLRDDEVGAVLADDARDLAAKQQRRLDLSGGPAQEPERADPSLARRGTLFGLTNLGALFFGMRRDVAAGVTRGHDAVRHVDAV